jgi:hypothetical protein
MFDEFDDELDSIVEKDNELSDDSMEDSDKTDTDKYDFQVVRIYNKVLISILIFFIYNFSLFRKRK